jgi:hypothetical protein
VDLEADPSSTDADMLALLTTKTEKITKTLKGLVPEGETKLTEENINDNVSNEAMRQWLARVAIAEGFL